MAEEDRSQDGRGAIFKTTVMTLFMAATCVILAFMAEFFLRYYYSDVLSTAYGWSYFTLRHQPDFKKEINGFRLRGKHFLAAANDNYRVVVLGDSLTYGQGVHPHNLRFTEKVEQFFNQQAEGRKIEVINVGINGHDLPHHLQFLHFIYAINPDFVLYQWFLNDMDVKPNHKSIFAPHLIKNRKIHEYLWQNSALYVLLQRKYDQFLRILGKQKTYIEYMTEKFEDPQGRPAVRARRLLVKLVNDIMQKKLQLGIVLCPGFYDEMDDYKLGFLHEQVLDVCLEQHIDCLDLRETYRDVPYKKLWANVFDAHPSALAHEMAATAIFNHFGPTWQTAIEQEDDLMGNYTTNH